MSEHSGRLLYVESPLEDDTLHLEAFEGAGSISRPFECRPDLLLSEEAIDLVSIAGKRWRFKSSVATPSM